MFHLLDAMRKCEMVAEIAPAIANISNAGVTTSKFLF
jgi:hypothetical protein